MSMILYPGQYQYTVYNSIRSVNKDNLHMSLKGSWTGSMPIEMQNRTETHHFNFAVFSNGEYYSTSTVCTKRNAKCT